MRWFVGALSSAVFMSGSVLADTPKVVTDIPPVQALVSRVMAGVGTPELVMRPGASPHGYALRPSEAGAIEASDLVVWVGPALTPWLDRAIDTLAKNAVHLTLMEAPGTTLLAVREGAHFEAHDHAHDDHEGHDHDEHAHDEHEGHDHDEHEGHDHDEHAGHDHGDEGLDAHAWLAPENAIVWLDVIAAELGRLDPENADTYASNAADGAAEIAAAVTDARATLAPFQDAKFIVFHDAYQYFETSMGVSATGAISVSDATDPGPARVSEIQHIVRDLGVTCVFSEPQFNPRLVATVSEGTDAKSAVLDPLGTDLDLDADMYPALIRALADEMAGCL